MSCSKSSPKILFIVIAKHKLNVKKNYHSWMNYMFDNGHVNFEIVEVSPRHRIKKKIISYDHRIVQFDPSANKVSIKPYNRKIAWFKDTK